MKDMGLPLSFVRSPRDCEVMVDNRKFVCFVNWNTVKGNMFRYR